MHPRNIPCSLEISQAGRHPRDYKYVCPHDPHAHDPHDPEITQAGRQPDRADKSLGSRHIQCAYYLESLQILKSGRHDGACLLLLSAVSIPVITNMCVPIIHHNPHNPLLENVAICVTPSGFRLPAETHHWGWHPRLLHATPPAFRSAPADVPFVGCVNVGHSREKYQARTVVPSALQPLQDSRCTAHGMCLLP